MPISLGPVKSWKGGYYYINKVFQWRYGKNSTAYTLMHYPDTNIILLWADYQHPEK